MSVSEISFPAILIHDGLSWQRIAQADQLGEMPSGFYMNRRSDPILIDSKWRVVKMTELKMEGSELSLIFTGPRLIRVSFHLTWDRSQSDSDAKAMVIKCLTHSGDSSRGSKLVDSFDSGTELGAILDWAAHGAE